MLRTIEATIDQRGNVKLREAVSLPGNKRALVTILEDEWLADELKNETALLAEPALDKDWLDVQEDNAWEHLTELPDLDAPKKHRNGRSVGCASAHR